MSTLTRRRPIHLGHLVVATFAIAASPSVAGPMDLEQAGPPATASASEAVRLGRIAGAAGACKSIDRNRVKNDIVGFNFVLLASSKTKDDFKTASFQFDNAIQEGTEAVQSGRQDCASALAALSAAEQAHIKVKTVANRKKKAGSR